MVVEWREHVTVPDEMHVHGRSVDDVVPRSIRVRLNERYPTLTVPANCIGNLWEEEDGLMEEGKPRARAARAGLGNSNFWSHPRIVKYI